jgi:hypothetical protein
VYGVVSYKVSQSLIPLLFVARSLAVLVSASYVRFIGRVWEIFRAVRKKISDFCGRVALAKRGKVLEQN